MLRTCKAAAAAAILAATASAVAGDYTADPLLASVDYTSANPLVAKHAHQRFALFRPAGTPPAGGTPVVIMVSNSGLASSDPCFASPISPAMAPIYQFLDAGFAVARACLTASDSFGDPSPCVPYPDLTGAGNGIFHPPGVTLPGLAIGAYADHSRPMAEKDCAMLVQHIRHNAAAYGLDPNRIALTGRSGGAVISMWCAAGPERGPQLFPGGTGQDAESTRVDAGVFFGAPLYFQALAQSQFSLPHFPLATAGAPWATPAPTLADTFPAFQDGASALVFENPAHALNADQRLWLTYGEPYQSTSFGAPYITNTLTFGHSSWFGYAWKTLHSQTRLVINSASALAPGGIEDAFMPDQGDLFLDAIQYLHRETSFAAAVKHLKTDGTPATDPATGAALTPLLTGSGTFGSGAAPTLALSLAKPNASALLVYHPQYVGVPLLGCILGPDPSNPGIPLPTDASGTAKFPVPAGAMPAGTSLWVQSWIADPNGPQGFTASNTIRIDS